MGEADEVIIVIILSTVLFLFLVTFIGALFWNSQKRQMHYFKEKAALKAQYEQEILTSQIEVQNATLQHISQELHDNIGQLLSVVRINLNIVEESGTDDENREFIQQANELVAQSISDLRALTKSLDGDFVQDFGLKESIAQELQRIRQTRKFGTELQITGTVYSLGFQREIVLFRIVQEILNNAIKHSEANQLIVQLHYLPEQLKLIISDDGNGFDYQAINENSMSRSGAGLRNIKRRVTLIGGTCEIISSPGNGTQLTLLIPNQ